MLNQDLIDVLACPKCKEDVEIVEDRIICENCKKYYPIKDNIPVMLIEEARDL